MNMRPQTSTNNTGGLTVFHHSSGSCCRDNPLEYTNNYTSERQEFSVDIPPSVRKVLLRPLIDATASGHPHLTRSNCSFVPRLSRNVNCTHVKSLVSFLTWCNENKNRVFRTERQRFARYSTNFVFNARSLYLCSSFGGVHMRKNTRLSPYAQVQFCVPERRSLGTRLAKL